MSHYLNNAGAGIMNDETFQTIVNYYQQERAVGAYQAAKDNKKTIDEFYSYAKTLVHAASEDEIAFVDSASRGWNLAVYGSEMKSGSDIITLSSEFGTNLITLYDFANRVGANVHVIKCDENGDFNLSAFDAILGGSNASAMIAISHAVAQGSIVNPVNDIGRIARKYNALYLVDACQTIGQIPVNITEIGCDILITTGRKWLCGPRGTGFMYVKSNSPIRATQLDLASADLILGDTSNVLGVSVRSDAKRFELWERNIASVLGFSTAISVISKIGVSTISREITQKSNALRDVIKSNSHLTIIGKIDSLSGIVGFYLNDPKSEPQVSKVFADHGIFISTMSDWDFPLAFPKNGVKLTFRLSPHYFTSDDTISLACDILRTL